MVLSTYYPWLCNFIRPCGKLILPMPRPFNSWNSFSSSYASDSVFSGSGPSSAITSVYGDTSSADAIDRCTKKRFRNVIQAASPELSGIAIPCVNYIYHWES